MAATRLVLAALALLAAHASAKSTFSPYWGEYNTTSGPVPGKINVHLVPHTHDDTGWLVTVDQYFVSEVDYILTTVTQNLLDNPDRKFIYVETGFFERWWIQQDNATQAKFAGLVKNGQLEFINGGWCMHDEAAPHYVEMVENTARGHQFLKKTFGIAPKGTWQIDPFGHTNTQAWLIGQYAGLQFLYFGRMDYADFTMRKNLSSMVAPNVPRSIEWVWQGSKTFGSQYQTFTGELYGGGGGGYGAPNNMDFDGSGNQVQDDPRLHDYNLDQQVAQFISDAQDQAAHTRTEHIMWAMGSDFNYQNAVHWYQNLDKLIHHVNLNGTVNAFYSTPSIYTEWKHKANLTWEARFDDVMPLADNAHHYWSGYFTSRQSLKKYLRRMSSLLLAARQMALLTETDTCTTTTYTQTVCTDNLEAAIAVSTHHDGLSGTEKQAVADDYAMRIAGGEVETRGMVAQVFEKMTGLGGITFCEGTPALNISFCPFSVDSTSFTLVAYNPLGQAAQQVLRVPIRGASATVKRAADGSTVAAQVLPLSARELGLSKLYLQDNDMKNPARVAAFTNNATHVVTFSVSLPAVGYETYEITTGSAAEAAPAHARAAVAQAQPASPARAAAGVAATSTISNDFYEVTLDHTTGTVSQVKNLKSGVVASLSLDVGFYNSSLGGCTPGVGPNPPLGKGKGKAARDAARARREEYEYGMDDPVDFFDDNFACDGQKSGAYIFRPNTSNVWPAACTTGNCQAVPTIDVVTGALVSEATLTFADWATVVIRLVQGQARVEVEYTVGPIPQPNFEGGSPYLQGKEVVLRYNSSLASQGAFYADSNAREMVRRDFNKRGPAYPNPYPVSEPVAGNYYPVNALLALQDEAKGVGLSVAVDRALGGASLADGSLELMVHRRTQDDDSRGVGQPMNETMCGCRDQDPNHIGQCGCAGLVIKGTNYLVLDTIENTNVARRQQSELLNFEPVLAFSPGKPTAAGATFGGLGKDLPANVKLMTLGVTSPQYNDKVYLRLSHLYEAGESAALSKVVNVSLADYFTKKGLSVASATEVSLTGNQTPAQVAAAALKWPVAGEAEQMPFGDKAMSPLPVPFDAADPALTVVLRPMDIRTFEIVLQ